LPQEFSDDRYSPGISRRRIRNPSHQTGPQIVGRTILSRAAFLLTPARTRSGIDFSLRRNNRGTPFCGRPEHPVVMYEIPARNRNQSSEPCQEFQPLEDYVRRSISPWRFQSITQAAIRQLRQRPAQMMRRADFEEHIGKENICANIQEALERARQLSGVV